MTATENKYHNAYILERESTKKAFWGVPAQMLNRKDLETQKNITLRSTIGLFFLLLLCLSMKVFRYIVQQWKKTS